jgi:hypothetical protein
MPFVTCPGCGYRVQRDRSAAYDGYYNVSAECWSVYTGVLAIEYSNAVAQGVGQLTVDAYAVQHAGGGHPDKSVAVHLAGLHLMLRQDVAPSDVAPLIKRIADGTDEWPHYDPPKERGPLTIADVALAVNPGEHTQLVRAHALGAFDAWSRHHADIATFVAKHL